MAIKMAIKWFQCEYTLLHRRAWQRSEAWQSYGADWSLEVLGRAWQSLAEANVGGSEYCSSWLATLLYFIPFRQPPLPPTKLGAAKPWPAYGVDTCGSCLEYSFSCLGRLFSCTVCDWIMSVIKIIWCHKYLLKPNGFHHVQRFLLKRAFAEAA
jgi:hypothetical protein